MGDLYLVGFGDVTERIPDLGDWVTSDSADSWPMRVRGECSCGWFAILDRVMMGGVVSSGKRMRFPGDEDTFWLSSFLVVGMRYVCIGEGMEGTSAFLKMGAGIGRFLGISE